MNLFPLSHTILLFIYVGQFKELQKISFGRGFILGVDLFHLPALSCEPLLVCGGDDAKVHLFARQEGKVYINFMYKWCVYECV